MGIQAISVTITICINEGDFILVILTIAVLIIPQGGVIRMAVEGVDSAILIVVDKLVFVAVVIAIAVVILPEMDA